MSLPVSLPEPDERRRFSDVLVELERGDNPRLTLGEMVTAFGERGFGAVLLLLAMMALFPWPPGGKAIFAVPIILIAAEMALQLNRVWLPKAVLSSHISRANYRRLLHAPIILPRWIRRRLLPQTRTGFRGWLKRKLVASPSKPSALSLLRSAERLTRPRWPLLTGAVSDTLIGLAIIALAVMMALPIPLGDAIPGLAIMLFALGIIQRDGVFVMAGVVGTAISGAYLLFIWKTVVAIFTGIASALGNVF